MVSIVSMANISLENSSLITNLKEKQSDEFLGCLILRTIACWEIFAMALKTGSSIKSDMTRSFLRVSTISTK